MQMIQMVFHMIIIDKLSHFKLFSILKMIFNKTYLHVIRQIFSIKLKCLSVIHRKNKNYLLSHRLK